MKRLNFTLDEATVQLLENLSVKFYSGNKSQTVRAALESLAAHEGHDGWVVTGYTPHRVDRQTSCYQCGTGQPAGNVLYKPVFERGNSPAAIRQIPDEVWVECSACVENRP